MNIIIIAVGDYSWGAKLQMDFADTCIWRTRHRGDPPIGIGDIPTEALQNLLVKLWESGDRTDEVRDMLAAEHDAKGMMRNEG